jgi:peptidoglycan hydrolase-like protein with peptidoglycan-binding domain
MSRDPVSLSSSTIIKETQAGLARQGLYDGVIDGLNGRLTENGIKKLQVNKGLTQTGILDKDTFSKIQTNISEILYSALPNPQEYKLGDKDEKIKHIQHNLKIFGYTGPIDGKFGPETEKAVKRYQQEMNLEQSGKVDRYTASLLAYFPGKEKVDEVFWQTCNGLFQYELIRGKSKLEDFEIVAQAWYNRLTAANGHLAFAIKGWNPGDKSGTFQDLIYNSTPSSEGSLAYKAAKNTISFTPQTPLGTLATITGVTDYAHLNAMPGGRQAVKENWLDKVQLSSLSPAYHDDLASRTLGVTESGERVSMGYDRNLRLPTLSQLALG